MPADKPRAEAAPPTTSLVFAAVVGLVVMAGLWLAPGSGIAESTMKDWHDQAVFLQGVVQTIEQGIADASTRGSVGPAYIGLAIAVGKVFGLGPEGALMMLSRLTFVACAGILSFIALRDRAHAGPAMQFVLIAAGILSLITSVWFRVFDVPWTHFVATATLGLIVLVSLTRLPLALRSLLVGALFITLAQTRMFEAQVALVAAALILPLAGLRHWKDMKARPMPTLSTGALHVALPAIAGGLLGFAAVGLLSNNWSLYEQYAHQPGNVLTLQLAPIKAVQLFWDTCYATLCEFAPVRTVPYFPDSLDSWRQPLLLQLPGLIAAAAGLLALLVLRPLRTLRLPLGLWFAVLMAGGTAIAYVSGAPSGSPHLKYGFFRDFIAPLVLLTGAFVAAVAIQRAADGRWSARLVVPLVVFFAVLAGLVALRPIGLPPMPGPQVAQFELASRCEGGSCSFSLAALDAAGNALPYNDLAYVTCDGKPTAAPLQHASQLRIEAGSCDVVGIVPVAAGVLYTPDGTVFQRPGLDLRKPADAVSVPPRP
jgi:hypothetical protein